MGTVATLVLKDVRRRFAAPAALLLNLAIPLVIIGTIGLAFGPRGSSSENPPVLQLVLVDLDDTVVSRLIGSTAQDPRTAGRLQIRRAATREEGLERLRDEEAAAMVVVPAGFTEALLDGRTSELELVKNPAQSVMPVAAQQGLEVVALYLSVARRLLGDEAGRFRNLLQGRGEEDATTTATLIAALRRRTTGLEGLLIPPLIEQKSPPAQGTSGGFDVMAWIYPGMTVLSLLFVSLLQMRDLLREGQAGTLRRLLAAPVPAWQVVLSKVVAVAAVAAIAQGLLLAIGLGLGVRWRDPVALAAASAALVLATTGFASLLFSVVRTERQGDALGGIVVMSMSLAGGAFVPLEILPPTVRGIAPFTVNYWGSEALRTVGAGGGLAAIATPLVLLVSLGAAGVLAGMVLLSRRHARGAL